MPVRHCLKPDKTACPTCREIEPRLDGGGVNAQVVTQCAKAFLDPHWVWA